MYKKGAGNDEQGKDAGNRTLCPYRNFSQAIMLVTKYGPAAAVQPGFVQLKENLGKGTFWEKNQGKLGKLREFSDHFYNFRENSGNFILPNISVQIGCALRMNE